MFERLNKEEENKIKDFMNIYRSYLNPNLNNEIDTIINYIFDIIIKIYIEYRDIIPFVSVDDDSYDYYVLRPIEGKYSLLDYLINIAIQNLDSIELIDNEMRCNYSVLRKKIYINRKRITSLHDTIFNTMRKGIDKDRYLELYYKNAIYHEIGHMLHYKINNIKENTVYVPSDYLSLSGFPPLKKMRPNAKKDEIERRKAIMKLRAKEKLKNRISIYSVLRDKYNILNPDEIDECDVEVEKLNAKYEEIILPPIIYLNPVEEAFTECDAQVYSGIFENDIFDVESTGTLECFYLPLDSEHVLMTYTPSSYSFSSSIGFALKECISKQSYFRTVFLGKNDLFIEFLGEYDLLQVGQFSHRLISADQRKMGETQPLLDDIVEFTKNKGMTLEHLNIFFPLIYKDNRWIYYTDTIDKMSPNVLKKVTKIPPA